MKITLHPSTDVVQSATRPPASQTKDELRTVVASKQQDVPVKPSLPVTTIPPKLPEQPKSIPATKISKEQEHTIAPASPQSHQLIDKMPAKITSPVKLAKGNYKVKNNIEITAEGSLEIMPGSVISFSECGIICFGSIYARGDKNKEIVWQGSEGWDNITLWGEAAQGVFAYCHFSGGLGREIEIGKEGGYRLNAKKNTVLLGGALLYGKNSRGVVEDCHFTKNGARGALALLAAKDVIVARNLFSQNSDDAVLCSDCSPQIHDNKIVSNSKNGVVCEGLSAAHVEKNHIEGNGKTGIVVQNKASPVITDNEIVKNNCGISFAMESKGIARNNSIREQESLGIFIFHAATPTVENNILVANANLAVVCRDKARPLLRGNQCQKHKIAAIAALDTSSPIIEGNTLEESPFAFVVDTTATPDLRNNHTSGCRAEIQKNQAQANNNK
jgi:parallel beta-helix repeat protein